MSFEWIERSAVSGQLFSLQPLAFSLHPCPPAPSPPTSHLEQSTLM
ncbi:MAG: hypothetical protein KME42_05150 [Tildeniella nuda ZEHNDER 1965/U140]|nr:hypothetical protein [Tildeniella nuda ZEHNDER 1965/U140]